MSPAIAAGIPAAINVQRSIAWVLAAKNAAAIKVASAGNGNPMLSSAMKAATSQTPYIAMSCVRSGVTAAEPSNHF